VSLAETRAAAVGALLNARNSAGIWEGELSTSALSTATAVSALLLSGRADVQALALGGLDWLAENQNDDGGWGDTTDSPTNLSTTTLAWAAFGCDRTPAAKHEATVARAESCMRTQVGELTPVRLAAAIEDIYGDDRTFAVPILMNCALSGRFGAGREAWSTVRALPFELATLPHQLFQWLGLPMVSYALPALIAVGQVIHHNRPSANPLSRSLRGLARERTLTTLASIQPTTGGFLEATPLTSFVVMSLVGAERADHPVVEAGVRFLRTSVRPDGSWPIDTNLTTWVTTLAVNALAAGGRLEEHLSTDERRTIGDWLVAQQYLVEHPYTHAAAGGWAWTDLAGGVPDADDTAGALLALKNLGTSPGDGNGGTRWLMDLQNRDGGIPTFCRGWGKLPFDQSCQDLTAHALRAWMAWEPDLRPELRQRVQRARERAAAHLVRTQRGDGAWVPLWFGNQREPALQNPLYGTSRVVKARAAAGGAAWSAAIERGTAWLVSAQNADGGFGGSQDVPSSIEETALAVEALAGSGETPGQSPVVERAMDWLTAATDGGTRFDTTPIGLYFARLWYSERLYPLIFTASACEHALG